MIAFLALTWGGTLAGRAILRLSRADDDDVVAWLIAPAIGLAAAALLLGVTVAVGLPVRVVAAPFWFAVAAASIYAVAATRRSLTQSPAIGLAIAWLIALAMLAPDVAQGLLNYIGNPVGDGWSYIAYGNYLWELPNGTTGSLPPLQQYASHLAHTRYVASSLLAVVSPLAAGGGDTQSAAGPVIAATVFVFAASASAIAWLTGLTGWRAVVASVLAAGSPWVLGAIQVHNYDNLIALSFAPAIVVVAGSREWSIRTGVMIGWLLAAAVYAYVELSTFSPADSGDVDSMVLMRTMVRPRRASSEPTRLARSASDGSAPSSRRSSSRAVSSSRLWRRTPRGQASRRSASIIAPRTRRSAKVSNLMPRPSSKRAAASMRPSTPSCTRSPSSIEWGIDEATRRASDSTKGRLAAMRSR